MSSATASHPASLPEWELANRSSPDGVRFELVGGVLIRCMAGAGRHQRVQSNVLALLHAPARANGCLAVIESAIAIDESNARVPDVAVYCGDTYDDASFIQHNPCILVEVVSPSSEGDDFGPKRRQYRSLPSVRTYLVIEPDDRSITVFRSGDNLSRVYGDGESIDLSPCLPIALEVNSIFD